MDIVSEIKQDVKRLCTKYKEEVYDHYDFWMSI